MQSCPQAAEIRAGVPAPDRVPPSVQEALNGHSFFFFFENGCGSSCLDMINSGRKH